MYARELMSADPVCVTPGDPLLRAAAAMRDLELGMLPVVDGQETLRPVGVITARDIVVRHIAAGHGHTCICAHVMSRAPLITVHPDDEAGEAIRKMAAHRVRRVLVVERDRLVGVISASDLLSRDRHLPPDAVGNALQQISEPALAGV
ncbi:MAG TPA: CBS domain-containing protein [Longimicrobium sp.]|nr:CBS domain-containing protein [Longimicrobium sp.]